VNAEDVDERLNLFDAPPAVPGMDADGYRRRRTKEKTERTIGSCPICGWPENDFTEPSKKEENAFNGSDLQKSIERQLYPSRSPPK
jgi:hypothetical protein